MASEKNKEFLKKRKDDIQKELNILMEYVGTPVAPAQTNNINDQSSSVQYRDMQTLQAQQQPQQDEEKESILQVKIGAPILLAFQKVNIKIKRIYNDYFMVDDARLSMKLHKGDILKVEGNDILEKGRVFRFVVFRKLSSDYESNPLDKWIIIKN